jgi:primary-amine oxidase
MFQALIFARDTSSGNPDTNFYAFPLPLIPVMDARTKKIVRIDELATGGKGDPLTGKTHKPAVLEHCAAAEYVPELLPGGTRDDLKPLTVVQPDGPSFTVTDGNLIKWQKWQLRVTFNPREGAVLHDIRFDDRSIMYRLSMSDMVSSKPWTYSSSLFWSDSCPWHRLFRMPTLELLFTGSKPLILATEGWAMLSTT